MHWAQDAVFYHIYPLGLCGAPSENPPTAAEQSAESRLEALYEWSGHMEWLGVNALYLGPVFESGSHGYDTRDYARGDRRLGTNNDLKRLVAHLHGKGIRVVLDAVFNHVGRDFFAFRDLLSNGVSSSYRSWFSGLRFDATTPLGDPFDYDTWDGHYELVKLELRNPEVADYLLSIVDGWIAEFEIDGLRLDAANVMDIGFLERLSSHCRSRKEDFWLLGEVVGGDYRKWANTDSLDSVTNYEAYKGLYSSHNDENYFEIAHTLDRQFGSEGLYDGLPLYNFVDNHDVNRLASMLVTKAHLYPTSILLFTMPGVPSIYYGSEWGIEGRRTETSDAPLRPALSPHEAYTHSPNRDLVHCVRTLIALRAGSAALQRGGYRRLAVSHRQLAFLREAEGEQCIVAVNAADREATLEVEAPEGDWHDRLNGRSLSHHGGTLRLALHPNWGAVLFSSS